MTDRPDAQKIDEADLHQVNGGFIVNFGGTYSRKYVVDDRGDCRYSTLLMEEARNAAAKIGVSDMVITTAEWGELSEKGYFIRDGIKYHTENGVLIVG